MIGFLLRISIIIVGSLVTVAWFPTSLLPLWITLFAANFFSIREGTLMFAGFSIMSLMINTTWWNIFIPLILWLGLASIVIPTLVGTEKKVSLPIFFITCFLLSFGLQAIAAFGLLRTMLVPILVVTIGHMVFIALFTFPVKILGEAYTRYINALGINYE